MDKGNRSHDGYLLPEVVDDGQYICFMVKVPNHELYRQAILGQWAELTKWITWEKRGDASASEAAQLWRHGEPKFIPCDEIITNEDDIMINVNVTSNCGCGCGGGVAGGLPNGYPYSESELRRLVRETEQQEDYETQQEADDAKCELAGKLVDDYLDAIAEMATLQGFVTVSGTALLTALLTTGKLAGVLSGLVALGVTASGGLLLLAAAFVALVIGGLTALSGLSQAAVNLKANKSQIICDVYNATTEEQIRTIMTEAMGNEIASLLLENEDANRAVDFIVQTIDALLPDEILFMIIKRSRNLRVAVSTATNYDCSTCGPPSGLFTPFVVDGGGNHPDLWTVTEIQDTYLAGVRQSDSADKCASDGFCFNSYGGTQLEVTADGVVFDSPSTLDITYSFKSDFTGDLEMLVMLNGSQLALETLPGVAKWATGVYTTALVFQPDNDYQITVRPVAGDTDWLAVGIDLT